MVYNRCQDSNSKRWCEIRRIMYKNKPGAVQLSVYNKPLLSCSLFDSLDRSLQRLCSQNWHLDSSAVQNDYNGNNHMRNDTPRCLPTWIYMATIIKTQKAVLV